MTFRWTYVFGIIVAALVAFSIYDYKKSEKETEEKTTSSFLMRLKPDDVAKIEIRDREGVRKLEKQGELWVLLEPIKDQADQQNVQTFIAAVTNEKANEMVVEGKDVDRKAFGLDQPVGAIVFETKDGKKSEVKIGSVKAYDGSLYAQVDTENKISLASAAWDVHLSKPVRELRDKHMYRGSQTALFKALKIDRKGSQATELKLDKGEWKLTRAPTDAPKVSNDRVRAYIEQLKSLRALDFLSSDTKVVSPDIKITLTPDGSDVKPFVIAIAARSAKETEAATTSSDLDVPVKLYKDAVEVLRKGPEDFYDLKEPFKFEVGNVERLVVSGGELAVEIDAQVKDGKWVLTKPSAAAGVLSGEALNSKLNEFMVQVSSLEALRYTAPATKRAPSGKNTQIRFLGAGGKTVFELNWSPSLAETGIKSVYAKSTSTKLPFEIADDRIVGLGLAGLVNEPAAQTPAEAASTDGPGDIPGNTTAEKPPVN